MTMGRDEAKKRTLRERGGEMTLPDGPGRRVAESAIDERKSALLLEQPEVDMVERKRQRHAQPVNARRVFDQLTRARRRGERVIENGRQRGGHGGAESYGYAVIERINAP